MLASKKYGHLTILGTKTAKASPSAYRNECVLICRCDCGRIVDIPEKFVSHYEQRTCEDPECPFFAASDPGGDEVAKERKIKWICPSPDTTCPISKICKMCCFECPHKCKRSCKNIPTKCGAKKRAELRVYYSKKTSSILLVDHGKKPEELKNKWCVFTSKLGTTVRYPLKAKRLDWRDTPEEAQDDLDLLAIVRDLVEVRMVNGKWEIPE